jgi:hypothetical protein
MARGVSYMNGRGQQDGYGIGSIRVGDALREIAMRDEFE